ncbi:MAG: hypothetical protein GY724_20780 [Actinomycetia bacterium]|nr:hypothetical protein [Actinomycetes bacterium]
MVVWLDPGLAHSMAMAMAMGWVGESAVLGVGSGFAFQRQSMLGSEQAPVHAVACRIELPVRGSSLGRGSTSP